MASITRDRMQHLGRRALQEPEHLSIPPCVRTAECHKPVNSAQYKVEKHGWGEGRLPIPTFVDGDVKTEKDLEAAKEQSEAQSEAQRTKAAARAAAAAKMVRAQKLQPHQQLDTLKARARAAREFSAEVERRNAEKLRKSVSLNTACADSNKAQELLHQGSASKPPLIERHILPSAAGVAVPAAALGDSNSLPGAATTSVTVAASLAAVQGDAAAHTAKARCGTCSAAELSSVQTLLNSSVAVEYGAAADATNSTAVQTPQQQEFLVVEPSIGGITAETSAAAVNAEQQVLQAESMCCASHQQQPELAKDHSMQQIPAEHSAATKAAESGAATTACQGFTITAVTGTAAAAAAAAGQADIVGITGVSGSGCPPANTLQGETSAHGPPAMGHSAQAAAGGLHPISSKYASCRLLAFAQPAAATAAATATAVGRSRSLQPQQQEQQQQHDAVSTAAAYASVAAGHDPKLAAPCGVSFQPVCAAAWYDSETAAVPRWSPVPPATQLVKPLIVKQMCVSPHAVKGQPIAQQQEQQQRLSPQRRQQQLLESRPPWQGAKGSQPQQTASKCAPGSISMVKQQQQPASSGSTSSSRNNKRCQASKAGNLPVKYDGGDMVPFLTKLSIQVEKHQLRLPTLCGCAHQVSILDPSYVSRCCSNCPLHNNAEGWKRLLLGLLGGMGLVDF